MAGQDDNQNDFVSSITSASPTSAETNAGEVLSSAADITSNTKQTASPSANNNENNDSNNDNNNDDSNRNGNTGTGNNDNNGDSSSTIRWGPAITASPLPNSGSNQGNESNSNGQQSDGLTDGGKKALISATTIGAIFVLILLLYALWRRRRGFSYSEIVRFRPRSKNMTNKRLTGFSEHRQERFPARSSKRRPQMNAFGTRNMSRVPSTLRKGWRVTEPLNTKSSNTPNTPTTQDGKSFLKDATPPSKSNVEEPEKAHIPLDRTSTISLPVMRHSTRGPPTTPVGGIQQHDRQRHESFSPPHSPDSALELQHRWSWTNSQAPSTPRITAPTRTSLTSLRLGSVSSWVKSQKYYTEDQRREAHKRSLSRPHLKNQAIRPVLAPPPISKRLTKKGRHARIGSLSSIFRQNPNSSDRQPLSPRLLEENSGTSTVQTSIEMTRND